MSRTRLFKSMALGGVSALALSTAALASNFDIPSGDLETALNSYIAQTGTHLIVSEDAVKGVKTRGVRGELPEAVALARILAGTGFSAHNEAGVIAVVHEDAQLPVTRLTQAAPIRMAATESSGIESVVVTSSKIKGDIQTVPIAITALSQEQLTSRQIAGGPDLVKEVPNLTFSKTNFTG